MLVFHHNVEMIDENAVWSYISSWFHNEVGQKLYIHAYFSHILLIHRISPEPMNEVQGTHFVIFHALR